MYNTTFPKKTCVSLKREVTFPRKSIVSQLKQTTSFEHAPDPAEVVAATAARTLPSTRAGGQDDVSSNKLPQNIDLLSSLTQP